MAIDERIKDELGEILGPPADPAGTFEEVQRRLVRRGRIRRLRMTVLSAAVIIVTCGAFALATQVMGHGRDSGPAASGAHARNGLIAFSASDAHGNMELITMRPDGMDGRVVVRSTGYLDDAAWSPDGTRLAFVRDGDLWITEANGSSGDAHRVASGVEFPTWSPDGSRILFVHVTKPWSDHDGTTMFLVDPDGSHLVRLMVASSAIQDPTWSPDGSRIAYQLHDQICVMSNDGTNQLRLTRVPGGAFRPDWSPDGRWLLFSERSDQLFRMRPDGSSIVQLTHGSIRYWDASWSPDGTRIVAEGQPTGTRQGEREIYVMNADGSSPRALTNLARLGVNQSALWADWQPVLNGASLPGG